MNKIELLKQIYEKQALDPATLHPDFTLHSYGKNLLAGEFSNLEDVVKHLNAIYELTNNTFEEKPFNFLADDNFGMVSHRMTGERNGKKLDVGGFGLWGFKDGLIIDHWEICDDPVQWDDFWS